MHLETILFQGVFFKSNCRYSNNYALKPHIANKKAATKNCKKINRGVVASTPRFMVDYARLCLNTFLYARLVRLFRQALSFQYSCQRLNQDSRQSLLFRRRRCTP